MNYLVCLLEEPSAKEMLCAVLPRILPDTVMLRFMVFEGKQDLEKQIEKRLKHWQIPNSHFLIMRDQDMGDCRVIKKKLQGRVQNAGKQKSTIVRIACRELESFYLGDLAAVEKGMLLNNLQKQQNKQLFRNPDALPNPSIELEKLTNKRYQKISGSRQIAPLLKLDGSNRSHSFNCLLQGIQKLYEGAVKLLPESKNSG